MKARLLPEFEQLNIKRERKPFHFEVVNVYVARLGDLPQVDLQLSNEVETNSPKKFCWKECLENSGDKGFVYHLE